MLRRLISNATTLFSGNAAASALALVAFGITARALGPSQLGILALISSYALIITRIFTCQSWQVLIRVGSDYTSNVDKQPLLSLFKLGFTLDSATALCGAVFGATAMIVVGREFDWDQNVVSLAAGYCITVVANVTGTPTAILRLYDRFDLLAAQSVLSALIKLVLVTILYMTDAGLIAYVIAWGISQIAANCVLVGLAFWQLRIEKLGSILSGSIKDAIKRNSGILRSFMTTSADGIVRMFRDLDIPVLGLFAGVDEVGLYKAARQISATALRVADPFYYAIFPDLSKYQSSGDWSGFSRMIAISSVMVGGILSCGLLIFLLLGHELIELALTDAYSGSFTPALWLLAGVSIWGFAQPISPALMAFGSYGTILTRHSISVAVYLPLLIFLGQSYGAIGAGIAYAIFMAIWSALAFAAFRREYGRRNR